MSLPRRCKIPVIMLPVSIPAPGRSYNLHSKPSCGLKALKAASETSPPFIMPQTHLHAFTPWRVPGSCTPSREAVRVHHGSAKS